MNFENDSGLTNGLGVLDTALVKEGVVIDRALHFTRLRHDCQIVLRVPCPDFEDQVDALLQKAGAASPLQRLRVVITAGDLAVPLALPTHPRVFVTLAPAVIAKTPLTCKIIKAYPRISGCNLENCKRTDYTRAFAARHDAQAAGCDDAIVTNTDGTIACGTTSNVFISERGALITPPLADGALAGITRGKLIAAGAIEDTISIERLRKADAVFLTNSITGQRPVSEIMI